MFLTESPFAFLFIQEVIRLSFSYEIKPKQPFFVLFSENYLKYPVNSLGISHFYQCKTNIHPRYVVPDGCVDMVFCCSSDNPSADICGPVLQPEIALLKPHTCYFGVRFLPGYNPILENTHIMKCLINQKIPLEELINDERMVEGIWNNTNFISQIQVFMRSYMSIYRRINPEYNNDILADYTTYQLIYSKGNIPIEKIAENSGYSVRYLNKRFKDSFGISPKQFAEIIRFQNSLNYLNMHSENTLTDISVECGYFDQSHFVHAFKRYTGITPKKYRTQLSDLDFSEKLKIILDIAL